ncbi:MAG TPA: SDR family oxidoreductase [Ktedonobacterales bacterium]|jgi:NAD(P)-dependent dehydrogenase (short-subunit alcohol dehydrogenase family)
MLLPSFDLTGKVAIVTGSTRGIGLAIAAALANAGAKVVIVGRKPEGVAAAVDELQQAGYTVLGVPTNISKPEDLQRLVQSTEAHFGMADILVNNAATNVHFGPLMDADDGMWTKMFETNIMGAVRLTRLIVPQMKERQSGKIINIASVAGILPGTMQGIYSATKAAIVSITRSMAQEFGHWNIQVNAIAPGVIQTRFANVLVETPQIRKSVEAMSPLHRIGTPDEIAGMALFLASPASNFTTGAVMVVDGGLTIGGHAGPPDAE